jgi:hypothetical protein
MIGGKVKAGERLEQGEYSGPVSFIHLKAKRINEKAAPFMKFSSRRLAQNQECVGPVQYHPLPQVVLTTSKVGEVIRIDE